jgi:hypothetical protein
MMLVRPDQVDLIVAHLHSHPTLNDLRLVPFAAGQADEAGGLEGFANERATHGPKLRLNAAAAKAIGLAMHELARRNVCWCTGVFDKIVFDAIIEPPSDSIIPR